MERLGRENEALKAEVAALRARSDGTAEDAVYRARDQLANALNTLDAVLSPRPTCSTTSACSSTHSAAANGCYGTNEKSTTNGCCPPSAATSTPSIPNAVSPREGATHQRPISPGDIPSRLGHPPKDEECCGGLFDCDAMIRTAVGSEPRMPQ